MNFLLKKIETVMNADGEGPDPFLGFFLRTASMVYGGAVAARNACYQSGILAVKRLPCAVISIGNITVGGAGKTPMTVYLARLVQQLGYKPVVVSRGYKGGAEKTGGVVSDGRRICMEPRQAGDEPFMMAEQLKNIPVVVGRNRYEAGRMAVETFKPDVAILDDAFQHRRLFRDLDLVLLDHRRPFGNSRMFPRGTLREPPVAGVSRADALILTRCKSENSGQLPAVESIVKGRPIFKSFHVPYIHTAVRTGGAVWREKSTDSAADDLQSLKGRNVFAFSGIANNRDFRQTILDLKCVVKDFLEFPDHHPYSEADLDLLSKSAKDAGAEAIFTTEKDYVRLSGKVSWPMDLVVLGVETRFGDDSGLFSEFIKKRLAALDPRKAGAGS